MTVAAMIAANMPREAFEELSEHEYAALARMAHAQGVETVARMFGPLSAADRKATLSAFMAHEVQTAQERIAALESAQRAQQAQPVVQVKRPTPLKVDVGKYKGNENESLLRWLVEIDAAMKARCIEDDATKVAFVMSNLAGRAKVWAFGRRLADETCFSSYSELRNELKATFEPPKTEFRARAEFLELRQGKRDIHAYCQYARYLVSCVVEDPIDDSTQVVMFIKGLTDGPVKTHLFREYPVTLEDAISVALQEDFSLQQAYVHSSAYRPPRAREMHEYDGTEPMDLSAADARSSFAGVCDRCQQRGHRAYECTAPRPVPRSKTRVDRGGQRGGGNRFGRGNQNTRNNYRSDRQGQNAGSRPRADDRRSRRDEQSKNAASQ